MKENRQANGEAAGGDRAPASRRQFLAASGVFAGFFVVPPHVVGGPGRTPPSERVVRAVIGCGGNGINQHVKRYGNIAAVCDVDEHHLARAREITDNRAEGCRDFRRVLERRDIDEVHVCTPPHWHALITVAALQAGKDVFCEKPMTSTIHEGKVVRDLVRRYGRVLQVNVHGRRAHGGSLRKVVQAGLLGRPVTVYHRGGLKLEQWSGRRDLTPQEPPAHLDYDLWLGPAPRKPYHQDRVHRKFRGYWDYDGGGLGDMGQHFLDPIQFLLAKDDDSPVRIESHGPPQHPDAVLPWAWVRYTYADGTAVILDSGEWGDSPFDPETPFLAGPKGRIYDRNGRRTDPPDLMERARALPDLPPLRSWEEAVKTRDDTWGNKPNVEAAHRSCTLVNLALLSLRTGRTIHWDPVNERAVDDPEANRLLHPYLRGGWRLPAI